MPSRESSSSCDICTFLCLPLEIRQSIYRYILPQTTIFDPILQRGDGNGEPQRSEYSLTLVREKPGSQGVWKMQKSCSNDVGSEIVWRLGCTSILATCHQVHDECVDLIYGTNVFVVDVAFDAIKFRQRWRTASNLTPGRSLSMMDRLSQRNLARIRNYAINVEHVDDYTGMIKYNCGGRGLTAGIRNQVQELVDLLSAVPALHRLHVHLIDGAISRVRFPSGRVHRVQDLQNYTTSQAVLEPFRSLRGVRRAKVTGVTTEYADALESSMSDTKGESL